MSDFPIAAMYRATQAESRQLFRELSADQFALAVPACPEWTVHQLLAHLYGVVDDVLNGRLDGVATDPWTAAQVERWQDTDPGELLERWDEHTPAFADLIEQVGQFLAVFDAHEHEHDLRGAVGRPGNRDSAIIEYAARNTISGFTLDRPLEVHLVDGRVWRGGAADGEPLVVRSLTPFELFRSRIGRRSRAQVEAYDWSGPADDAVGRWFNFGPAVADLVE